MYRRRVEVTQVQAGTVFGRDPAGECYADVGLFHAVRHPAGAAQVGAVCQHAQRDILEALPILQKIGQDVITDLVDVLSVRPADRIQMRGVNDHLAANGHRWFELVHGLGRRPHLIVHGRGAGEHALEGLVHPADVALGR